MATSGRIGMRRQQPPPPPQQLYQRRDGFFRGVFRRNNNRSSFSTSFRLFSSRKTFRLVIVVLAFMALAPPVFFHFRLRRFQQMQSRKCGWLNHPPLVCAHGGDTTNAFPNTVEAYRSALRSQVDCIEIDVSRSSDGVLFALHDRDLQQISGNSTSRVGHLTMKEIKELDVFQKSALDIGEQKIPTIVDALKLVSSSVRQVILDAKVGPPSYEDGLAKDILSIVRDFFCECVKRSKCTNCVVWAKSDSLARDVIKLTSDVMVGYIVMVDPNTGRRNDLLRIKEAGVVGIYHRLVNERLVRLLHRRQKKVYTWTVDEIESMRTMLMERVDAIVTNRPSSLQQLIQDIRSECREEGFSLPR
ncbi:Glycerophosphodiester phosphodiesterase GDPD4 [Linum perenne]